MSSARLAALLLTPFVVAVVGVLVAASQDSRGLVLRNNGFPAQAQPLRAGTPVCQGRLVPAAEFDRVRFGVSGAGTLPGSAVSVSVRGRAGVLARGRLDGGFRGQAPRTVLLDRPVAGGQTLRVCFSRRGKAPTFLFGDISSPRGKDVTVGGRPVLLSLQLDLGREPRSALSTLPTILHRASVTRPGVVGPWLYWVLVVLLLTVVPAALLTALGRAARRPEGDQPPPV